MSSQVIKTDSDAPTHRTKTIHKSFKNPARLQQDDWWSSSDNLKALMRKQKDQDLKQYFRKGSRKTAIDAMFETCADDGSERLSWMSMASSMFDSEKDPSLPGQNLLMLDLDAVRRVTVKASGSPFKKSVQSPVPRVAQ